MQNISRNNYYGPGIDLRNSTWIGSIKSPRQSPIIEPPNDPKKPPVEEPGDSSEAPPPTILPPIKEPPNDPKRSPVKEPPPENLDPKIPEPSPMKVIGLKNGDLLL